MEGIYSYAASHPVYVVIIVALASLVCLVAGVILGSKLTRKRATKGSSPVSEGSSGRGGKREQAQFELYVGNLPYEMDDAGLKKLIDPFGEVLSARIITNRISGASKGYGFVKMASADGVTGTISSLNNKEIDGRRVSVSEARTRPRGRRG